MAVRARGALVRTFESAIDVATTASSRCATSRASRSRIDWAEYGICPVNRKSHFGALSLPHPSTCRVACGKAPVVTISWLGREDSQGCDPRSRPVVVCRVPIRRAGCRCGCGGDPRVGVWDFPCGPGSRSRRRRLRVLQASGGRHDVGVSTRGLAVQRMVQFEALALRATWGKVASPLGGVGTVQSAQTAANGPEKRTSGDQWTRSFSRCMPRNRTTVGRSRSSFGRSRKLDATRRSGHGTSGWCRPRSPASAWVCSGTDNRLPGTSTVRSSRSGSTGRTCIPPTVSALRDIGVPTLPAGSRAGPHMIHSA